MINIFYWLTYLERFMNLLYPKTLKKMTILFGDP